MRGAPILLALGATLVATSGLASDASASILDGTPYITAAYNPQPDERSMLQVECKLRSDGDADCTLTQVMLRVPNPQKIEADIAEREKDVTALVNSAKFPTFCKKLDADFAAAEKENVGSGKPLIAPGDRRGFNGKQLQKLCKSKDLQAYLDAVADFDRKIAAKTCWIDPPSTWSAKYTKVDEDTWISTTTAGGLCNITLVSTLWRRPKKKGEKDDFRSWSTKQVRTLPPNADPKQCPQAFNSTIEHRWDGQGFKKVDCTYFDI
ncbi:MAG: hypothetical protein HYV09_06790 [Deltaproteobacteria bacterium]|nr:hypothetical protein [Deltaproteobacteria bacterium]